MKKQTIMLSIDSSTKKTGIAVWENGRYRKHYLINYDEKDRTKNDPLKPLCKKMDSRYVLMVKDILKILENYKPSIIYIEDEVVTRNMNTCRFLFRLQGLIECWCINNDCEFNTVRPTVWRKACGFSQGKNKKREQLKEQSVNYIKKMLHLTVTDDEADAICIGIYALKLFNIKLDFT